MELRLGYTLNDLHNYARLAVHTAGASAGDWHERYDTAWSAIAEHLYAAVSFRPTRYDFVRVGQLAIYAAVDQHQQAYGYYRRKTDGAVHGLGSSPAFRTYWWDMAGGGTHSSPEGRIVEQTALRQIMPTLTPAQREAITALAVHGTYQAAAAALGANYDAFVSNIATARKRFLKAWHQGEAPSRIWRIDRRVSSHGKPAASSHAARRTHRRQRQAKAAELLADDVGIGKTR